MTISKLAAILSLNGDQFAAGAKKAEKDMGSMASSFKSAGAVIAGVGAAIGAGAAVAGIVALTKSSMENIDATTKMSDVLGISTQSLSQLHYAATVSGASTEGLNSALIKMQKSLAKAEDDGGKAAEAFKKLGLNEDALINLPADQAFKRIADALGGVENASQRNAYALAIFGKGAAEILPLINRGSAGLDALAAEADKLGYSFSRIDAKQVEQANEAIKRLKAVLEGAANVLAIELAPYLTVFANKLVEVASTGDGLGGIFDRVFHGIVEGIAIASDYLELFKSAWYVLKTGVLVVASSILKVLSDIAEGFNFLLSLIGIDAKEMSDTLGEMAASVAKDADEAGKAAEDAANKFANGENSAKTKKYFDEIELEAMLAKGAMEELEDAGAGVAQSFEDNSKSIAKASEKIADLQKQVEQFNMTKAEKEADDIKRLGGDAGQQQQAMELAEQLDALEETKKAHEDMAKEAKKVWEESRTDLDKYNDAIERNQTLLEAGAIDEETFEKANAKAQDELEKALDKGKKHKDKDKFEAPTALEVGSKETASFIAKVQAQGRGEELQKRANDFLSDIRDNTGKGQFLLVNMN